MTFLTINDQIKLRSNCLKINQYVYNYWARINKISYTNTILKKTVFVSITNYIICIFVKIYYSNVFQHCTGMQKYNCMYFNTE